MSLTDTFIDRLEGLKDGDRAKLRQLAGHPLDQTLEGFDLFTGLWWPLRQKSARWSPERRSAWLVAKLYGAFPTPHVRAGPAARPTALPCVLGRAEPRDEHGQRRFRERFDALLLSPLSGLEPHLRWALSVARGAVGQGRETGINWVQLVDDLKDWDRDKTTQERWAEQYLNSLTGKGDHHGHGQAD